MDPIKTAKNSSITSLSYIWGYGIVAMPNSSAVTFWRAYAKYFAGCLHSDCVRILLVCVRGYGLPADLDATLMHGYYLRLFS